MNLINTTANVRGNLTVVENGKTLPFDVKRVYYLYDIPGGESRGAHAHRDLEQFMIAASGSFKVTLDDGNCKRTFFLNRPYQGLYIKSGMWRDLDDFSSGAICMVLASEVYRKEDYIRDYEEFIDFRRSKKMRILWTINMLMPNAAKAMGLTAGHAVSWIDAMSKRLSVREDIKLAIACPLKCDKPQITEVDNITYYTFPSKDCEKVDYWTCIINSFKPEVIHAYGTEGKHNYLLLKNHSEVPIVVSLQGIISEYEHHYYAGIDFSTMLRYTTLKRYFSSNRIF